MLLPPTPASLWTAVPTRAFPPLAGDVEADVAVVGGGITGLTTAALLAREGLDVVVLEGRTVGAGTTGRTTAKVTALQGLRYRTITEHHGATAARRYASAQLDALAWLDEQVTTLGTDCAWEQRSSFTYATTDRGRRDVEAEAVAASAAGLPVALADPRLPYPTTGAVELAGQFQFDPGPYLSALATEIDASANGRVHEESRVTAIRGRRTHEVVTDHGTVRAGHVVVATLLPILYRGLFFARAEPTSSYVVALRVDGPLPQGMYISADSPTRSLRTARHDDGEVLLVGGAGHDTGRAAPTTARYEELVEWAVERFPVTEVIARWSAHDYVPADHLPWVGPASPLTPKVMVASGFEKWGMSMGTAAALALSERITGQENGVSAPWAGLFDPARLTPKGLVSLARINAEVAKRMVEDWARPEAGPDADGDGARHRHGLVPVGHPERTTPDEVSVVCTHLGGICSWNDAERTWDCPLHGSRFEQRGTVLTGPATKDLKPHPDHQEDQR